MSTRYSLFIFVSEYVLTEKFPMSENFGLINQIRRASVSIASNISEGCSGILLIEKKRFLEISRSSLIEIDTQLIILRLTMINEEELNEFDKLFNELFSN